MINFTKCTKLIKGGHQKSFYRKFPQISLELLSSNLKLYFHTSERLQSQINMDDQQQFCLRWNDFQTNMVASFKHLRDEKSFTDVTIACDGQSTKAHKMILSACSPYFKVIIMLNAY